MSRAALIHRAGFFMCSIATSIGNTNPESKQAGISPGRWLSLFLAAFLCLTGCQNDVRVKNTLRTFRTVVIDPGHGGFDLGASTRWGGAEKNDALETALRLDSKLRDAGFQTVLTRDNDTFIQLNERARISNAQKNAIFIAIHYNQTNSHAIHGLETYYRSSASRELAERIQQAISALPGETSRGVKTANFRVLRRNEYPAVLVECGFLSNPREGRRCATPEYHELLAAAIAGAVIDLRGPLNPHRAAPATTAPVPAPDAPVPTPSGATPPPPTATPSPAKAGN
jgi:N-acetylmuramoyl-L-alanine amidase